MSRRQKRPKSIAVYQWTMGGVLILIVIGFYGLVRQQLNYSDAIENRQRSMQLAAELRQSSNDLARLVRTYIITGNPKYKEQFRAVHEIRDGLRPRPINYSLAYWDTQALDLEPLPVEEMEQGDTVPLIDLLKETGITEQEFLNLKRSKEVSDRLVEIEKEAIELFEQSSSPDSVRVDKALSLLADDTFMAGKALIMSRIVQTEQMIIDRTERAVSEARSWLIFFTQFVILSVFILLILIFMTGRHLRRIIGGSVTELQSVIGELGEGDFLKPIELKDANAESIIGWLAKTQRKLAALNLGHFKAIIDSSDDAIASKTTQGIVTSWNRGAEKIFGYTADEIIGKPMTTIIPGERLHEEPEILDRIMHGQKVDHFITQRQHKNGQLIDVSVTISPVYSKEGKVIGASKIARDITDQVEAEAEIKRLALFDTLTGLANRRLLHDRIEQMHSVALREQSYLMVVFIDLDNFKPLNDSHGHEAGDALLTQAGIRLKHCVRKSDTVARFGGDEFVILLRGPKKSEARSISWADTILDNIRDTLNEPYHIGDIHHICTPSIGISELVDAETTPQELIVQADQAMYRAKKMGKNTTSVFSLEV